MKKKLAKKAFDLARTPFGGLIVGLAFGKFSKALPVKKIKETDKVIAFWHPKPYWEKHILIVPKKPIRKISALKKDDFKYIEECMFMTKKLVNKLDWEGPGYTVLINGGKRQEVNQLHFHLISGKKIKIKKGNVKL